MCPLDANGAPQPRDIGLRGGVTAAHFCGLKRESEREKEDG